jgi:hypothetical protein
MAPDIDYDETGRAWFWSTPDEVAEAVDELPIDVLREQFERVWRSSDQPQPRVTDRQLRASVRSAHVDAAAREPREITLSIVEAAKHLGMTARVLGYELERGRYAESIGRLKGGELGLRFTAPARRRLVMISRLRPDPRLALVGRPGTS